MNNTQSTFRGVIRGKTIELETLPDLPDGQEVSVSVRLLTNGNRLQPGEGLRRAFGGWAEDASKLDEFVEQVQRDRADQRPEPNP